MPWQELTFTLSADEIDAFEDALLGCGALSVTLRDAGDQPLMEPGPDATPVWDEALLTAMFDHETSINTVLEAMKSQLQLSKLPAHQITQLQDQEWRLTWREHFKPIQFGQRLWICPSGYAKPSQPGAVVINLDPGLAFGTGSHPTTSLCLQWLDANTDSYKDKTIIDYGCGSGVLAIAAAKLGAAKVLAVDNDPQALQATIDNATQNQVENCIHVCLPDNTPAESADVLLANILLEPLLMLQPTFSRLLNPGGQLVMSGILHDQAEQLKNHYQKDFNFQACEQQEEWVRLHATRR